jgi:hypothetical protein
MITHGPEPPTREVDPNLLKISKFTGAVSGAVLAAGQAQQSAAHRYRERRLESQSPQAADLQ